MSASNLAYLNVAAVIAAAGRAGIKFVWHGGEEFSLVADEKPPDDIVEVLHANGAEVRAELLRRMEAEEFDFIWALRESMKKLGVVDLAVERRYRRQGARLPEDDPCGPTAA